jgi:hypothetical protein
MGLSIFSTSSMNPDIEAISVPKNCCITASLARRQIASLLELPEENIQDTLTGKEWIVFYVFLHKVVISLRDRQETTPVDSGSPPKKRLR